MVRVGTCLELRGKRNKGKIPVKAAKKGLSDSFREKGTFSMKNPIRDFQQRLA